MLKRKNHVVLSSISIQGYRSCKDTNFFPHPKLTALIGINGSGKTNLLSAIRLLQAEEARRIPVPEETPSNETTITCQFSLGAKSVGLRIKLFLSLSSRGRDEVIRIDEHWDFESLTGVKGWIFVPAFLIETSRRFIHPRFFPKSGRIDSRMESEIRRAMQVLEDKKIVDAISAVNNFRSGISYYSASQFTDPTKAPSNFEVDSDGRLESVYEYRSIKSHVTFLHDLYSFKKNRPELYEEYVDFVSKKQLGLVSRISWKEVKLSSSIAEVKTGGKLVKKKQYKTLIIPNVQVGSSHITFNQLSEGTFKTLALIFYIMTDASSCLLIEEPEVCVHHGLLSKVVNTIKSYSAGKQVIFSTHSDLVLDTLSTENVSVVQLKRTGTTVSKLHEWAGKKGFDALNAYLEESGSLGDYWKSGGFTA